MDEQRTGRHRPWGHHIPDEAREHAHAAREELRKSMEALLPDGFVEHRRAAHREMLKAARSMIDAALERLEAHEA